MKPPGFHALDRLAAVAKAVAFVGSIAYFLAVGKKPQLDAAELLVVLFAMVAFGVLLEGAQVFGLWWHRRWGFGLTAAWYALGFLSSVFVLVVEATANLPMRPRQLLSWHDMYELPIASYCAYRYYTFARFEGNMTEEGEGSR